MLVAGLARAGADEGEAEALYPRLLDRYAEALAVETRLYDGAEAALDRLAADGWQLAVCTNQPERLARLLLEALGVAGRFAALLGADSLPWKKPDPRHLVETIARAGGEASPASAGARHPSYWGAAWTTAAAFLAYVGGVWFAALFTGADLGVATAVAGRLATSWFGVSVAAAAFVSAWAGIALVRTRAHRPRWPWEDDFDE